MNQAVAQIVNMVTSIRRRWLLRLTLLSLAMLGIAISGWLLSMIVIDNAAMLGTLGLIGGWVVIIALLGAGLVLVVDQLTRRRPSNTRLALCYEQAVGDQHDRLVNAVQMLESGRPGNDPLAAAVVIENAARLNHAAAANAIDMRSVRDKLLVMAGVLLPLVLYVAMRPAWASNAVERLLHPFNPRPHLLETSPRSAQGDVTIVEGSPLTIDATLRKGVPVAQYADDVAIEYQLGSMGWSSAAMKLGGDGRFTHELDAVWHAMSYRIHAGRGLSPVYHVTLRQRPRVTNVQLTVTEPAYAGGSHTQLPDHRGDATVLAGSMVQVNITADRALAVASIVPADSAAVKMKISSADHLRAECVLHVTHDVTYTIAITEADGEGLTNAKPAQYTISAAADQVPTALVTVPGRDMVLPLDATLPLKIEASDDIGLSAMMLQVRRPDGDWKQLQRWPVKQARQKSATCESQLALPAMKLKEGDVLLYRAVAQDNRPSDMGGPQTGPGHTWSITVGAAAGNQSLVLAQRKALLEQLKQLLKMQQDNRQALDMDRAVSPIAQGQKDIRRKTVTIIDEQNRTVSPPRGVIGELTRLADGPMLKLVRMMDGYDGPYAQRVKRKPNVLAMMDVVIERLTKLVGDVQEQVKQAEQVQESLAKLSPEQKQAELDKVRALLEKLRKFTAEQDKVIRDTQELARKGDNLTDKDEQKIEQLKGTEDKWSEVFAGDVKDINKLTQQGFADQSIANDYKEMVEQIEEASKKLDQKAVTMAVTREQIGREMATKLAEQMEQWLPAGPDNVKWQLEEPLTTPEIPMVDLPKELSDLIGDLVDKQDELNAASQDQTSAWADSMSAAGWQVGDGPISNYSAVGKTGNQLPNTNEMSGRAGEGRSGQSEGQLVQDVVRGLDGRTTPTRNTNDPYEQGVVKELQQTPTSGATGGGKERGGGQEGLQGDSPPPLYQNLQYMKDWQQRIRDKTERVVGQLKAVHIASPELQRATTLMKQAEDDARNGRYQQMFKRQKMVLTTLQAAQDLSASDVTLRVDQASTNMDHHGVLDAGDEPVPMEYRGAVERYFEQLSGDGGK